MVLKYMEDSRLDGPVCALLMFIPIAPLPEFL